MVIEDPNPPVVCSPANSIGRIVSGAYEDAISDFIPGGSSVELTLSLHALAQRAANNNHHLAAPSLSKASTAKNTWQERKSVTGSVQQYIAQFINASKEYKKAGEVEPNGLRIYPGQTFHESFVVFDGNDFAHFIELVACFRIPSVVQTASGVLLAFAEGRINTCADCQVVGIAQKTSFDGGRTWGQLKWAVPPTNTSNIGQGMDRGANPTTVFDFVRNRTLLHFVRGTQEDGDCDPGLANYQVISTDDGATWGKPQDLSSILGPYVGCLPGPGNGVQLTSDGSWPGRLLIPCHYGTAERSNGAVVVYGSDDGGESWWLSEDALPRMDESTVAELSNGTVMLNMRNAGGCLCRAVSTSQDGGVSWEPLWFDETLVDPICEGSLAFFSWAPPLATAVKVSKHNMSENSEKQDIFRLLLFSNPPMRYARANMTVQVRCSIINCTIF